MNMWFELLVIIIMMDPVDGSKALNKNSEDILEIFDRLEIIEKKSE